MTALVAVPPVSSSPAMVQLMAVTRAMMGVRTPAENPFPYEPVRVSSTTPAVKRVGALGSMVDRYL